MTTKDERGHLAETCFAYKATGHGLVLYRPLNVHAKEDFLVLFNGKYIKVQVKMGWPERGGHRVNLTKKRVRHDGSAIRHRYSTEDFDVLAVFDPTDEDFWLIASEEATKRTEIWFRKEKVKNPHGFDSSIFWKNWEIFDLLSREIRGRGETVDTQG